MAGDWMGQVGLIGRKGLSQRQIGLITYEECMTLMLVLLLTFVKALLQLVFRPEVTPLYPINQSLNLN